MTPPNRLPIPPDDPGGASSRPTDSGTGEPAPVADVRAEFERLSRQVPRDPDAERAFIENKIDMIRNDPHLSEAEKQRAIEQLGAAPE